MVVCGFSVYSRIIRITGEGFWLNILSTQGYYIQRAMPTGTRPSFILSSPRTRDTRTHVLAAKVTYIGLSQHRNGNRCTYVRGTKNINM